MEDALGCYCMLLSCVPAAPSWTIRRHIVRPVIHRFSRPMSHHAALFDLDKATLKAKVKTVFSHLLSFFYKKVSRRNKKKCKISSFLSLTFIFNPFEILERSMLVLLCNSFNIIIYRNSLVLL